ncbi:MAG: cell division protein SepF [Nanoarchaeota archaeon]
MVFNKIKKMFSGSLSGDESGEEYIEIDLGKEEKEAKVLVKLFALRQYEDVNEILNALRDGYTIAIIDIKQLRQRDTMETKRAISKIRKTIEALEGNIQGFGDNMVIATPSFATIHKHTEPPAKKDEHKTSRFD